MCQANHQGWDAFACSGGQDGKSVRRALEWTREIDGGRPFLLWVHLYGAHPPYYNGGDLANQLDPGYTGPDRRFHTVPLPDGLSERRNADLELTAKPERALSQDEIDGLFA